MTTLPAHADQPTSKRPHLRAVPDPPKFTAANARQHAKAEARVVATTKKRDDAIKARDKLRDRDRKKLPPGEEVVVGGVLVKRTEYSYETFSLKGYKLAGFTVTAKMQKHIGTQDGERWTVKPVK